MSKFEAMQVKFVGEVKRVNSFGVFEPGKIYDVSIETGEQLLSAPLLFERVGGDKIAKTAKEQVVDVTTTVGNKYETDNILELRDKAKERGITVRRGARKAELIEALANQDKKDAGNVEDIDNTETI